MNIPISDDKIPIEQLKHLGGPLTLLRHPFILKCFVDMVINPNKQLHGVLESRKLMRLLVLISIFNDDKEYTDVEYDDISSQIRLAEMDMRNIFESCNNLVISVSLL